jgi:hypothetical protein
MIHGCDYRHGMGQDARTRTRDRRRRRHGDEDEDEDEDTHARTYVGRFIYITIPARSCSGNFYDMI